MSHSGQGTYRVPLIGEIRPQESKPGYIARLLDRARPEVQRRLAEARRRLSAVEYRGRPHKKTVTEAAWVTDMAELRQCILLCYRCEPKFEPSHKAYGYHRDNRWRTQTGGVLGVCDGCRENMGGLLQLYIHESYLGKGPGQSYVPL